MEKNKGKLYSKIQSLSVAIKKVFYFVFVQKRFPRSKNEFKKYYRTFYRLVAKHTSYTFAEWIKDNEPKIAELNNQKEYVFEKQPKISMLTPTYNTPPKFFDELMESLINQTYGNWELCVADGGSSEETIITLKKWQVTEPRLKIKLLKKNLGIADNTNAAAGLADGEYIAILDHDDTLAPFALFEVVKTINETGDADFIYSDEDKINEKNTKRSDPHFKPDFAPDTLRAHNYICHFTVIKKSLFDRIGGFRSGFDGSQDYDLFLRAVEKAKKIVHISKILYHWRVHSSSVASQSGAKPYTMIAAKKAIQDHLKRMNIGGIVKDGLFPNSYKIDYAITGNPKISIIIPSKDHTEELDVCIKSILDKSTYKNYEIIIVENNSEKPKTFEYYKTLEEFSNIKIINWSGEFNFSLINNFGVESATGEILLLLNNDVEVINPDWLERMLEYVLRDDVGAVGAKLYYPDNSLQHAGIIVGIGGIAGHSHKSFKKDEYGYFGRAMIPQNLSAVTAACLMIKKDLYEQLGGLDETFKVAFNDVDFCLRIRETGKLIVFTPYAELYHHESKTRGYEDSYEKKMRFNNEIKNFVLRWEKFLEKGDPYYNSNLTLSAENFELREINEPNMLEFYKNYDF